MRKQALYWLLSFSFLAGCSSSESVVRIDVQEINEEGESVNTGTIIDEESLQAIQTSLDKVKWEPNTKPELVRYEDIEATLFIEEEKNMPERLSEYKFWFKEDGGVAILTNNDDEGFGELAGNEAAEDLKRKLFSALNQQEDD